MRVHYPLVSRSILFLGLGVLGTRFAVAQSDAPPTPVETAPRPTRDAQGRFIMRNPTRRAPVADGFVRSLSDALPKIRWDAARRGTLLIVDTEDVYGNYVHQKHVIPGQPYQQPQPLPDGGTDGLNLRDVATHFNRKVILSGKITVAAPENIWVLNTRLNNPDIFAGLQPDQKSSLFMATLTPAQWEQFGSPNGLGASDLSGTQLSLFLSLLPHPFFYRKMKSVKGGNDQTFYIPDSQSIELSEAERAQVRLRLTRKAQYTFPVVGEKSSYFGTSLSESRLDRPVVAVTNYDNYGTRKDAFGVTLLDEVPNRLKPGDLNFDAPVLNADIPLKDVKTVQDIIERIADTTNVELYVDPRPGKLPIYLRGESARAGDLLQALCWSIGGTFRRLDKETYVLTDDKQGLGTRMGIIGNWFSLLQGQLQQVIQKTQEKIAAQDASRFIHFSESDTTALPAAIINKMDDKRRKPEGNGYGYENIPMSEFPSDLQKTLLEAANRLNTQTNFTNGRKTQVRTDVVGVSTQLNLVYQIPGVGTSDSQYSGSGFMDIGMLFPRPTYQYTPPKSKDTAEPLSPHLKARAAVFAPQTSADIATIAKHIQSARLNQLWIDLPDDAMEAKKLLTEAVAVGKANQLPVYALAHLLSRKTTKPVEEKAAPDKVSPTTTTNAPKVPAVPIPEATTQDQIADNDPFDRNILGETMIMATRRQISQLLPSPFADYQRRFLATMDREWLRPDLPTNIAEAKNRLSELAQTPGLAGLAVSDIAPPGYPLLPQQQGFYFGSVADDMGYTPSMRLGFLRKEGCDPIDLSAQPYLGNVNIELPYFSTPQPQYDFVEGRAIERPGQEQTPAVKWSAFRGNLALSLLNDLYKTIRTANPTLPLFLSNPTSSSVWFVSWERPSPYPGYSVSTTLNYNYTYRPIEQQIRGYSKTIYNVATPYFYFASATPVNIGQELRKGLSGAKAWDGFVLDFSHEPVEKGLTILDAFATVPEAPAAPSTASAAATP